MPVSRLHTPLPPLLRGRPFVGSAPAFRRDPIALLRRGYEQFGPVFSLRLGARRAAVIVGLRDPALDAALLQSAFDAVRTPARLGAIIDRAQTRLDLFGASGEFELDLTIEDLVLEAVSCALLGSELRRWLRPDLGRLYRDILEAADGLLPRAMPLPVFRRRAHARQMLDERIAEMIDHRRASPGGHADVIQTLADARSSGGAWLPLAQLQETIHFLLFFTVERTPRQASRTMRRLLQQPEAFARVREEQDAVVGRSAGAITLDAIGQLTQLPRAIAETERDHPALTIFKRLAVREYPVAGYLIPRGWTTVICPPLTDVPGPGGAAPGRSAANLAITAVLTLLLQRYALTLRRHASPGSTVVCYRRR